MVSYEFISVESMTFRREKRVYNLSLVQQPKHSRMCGFGEKVDRRPVDPPPVVKLDVTDSSEEPPVCNPYYFMYATLMSASSDVELHMLRDAKTRSTTGSSVSSLYRLKDNFNKAGFFFVFPDLSVRMEGTYRLKFSLFEIINTDIYYCDSISSDPFNVFTAKKFPGMEESTLLSRIFAEQGLKIRIRKDTRARSNYKNEESSKRSREGDTDLSNSDASDDNSEKGGSSKRSKKIFSEKVEDGGYPQDCGSKGGPAALPYGYASMDPYQGMRMPYPPHGLQRPIYARDMSQMPSHKQHAPANSMENIQRPPHSMNVHTYPVMYFRYPYDPYAPRHYDPSMMMRPYAAYHPAQGYSKRSNPSDIASPTADRHSPTVVKLEQESSEMTGPTNWKVSQDTAKNINSPTPNLSDSNALRSFYEPSSASKSNSVVGGASNNENGNSLVYYYPPGAYGYPPVGDIAHGKRPYGYPSPYAYPVPVNYAMQGMMHFNAPHGGYYAPHYPGMYPPGPYPSQGFLQYPTSGYSPVHAGPGHNSTGSATPSGSFPPSSAYSPTGTTNFALSPHSQESIHAHGASQLNYQASGPINQKRDSIPTVRAVDFKTNSNSSPFNERNSPPVQNKSSGRVESSTSTTPNAESSEIPQSLYSRPPYPQFVPQSGSINLPRLNLANPQNSSSHENVDQASGSSVSHIEPGA